MAGHSHWAQIKHKKAKVDAQKGKLFSKLAKEIMIASRLGGPNPDHNPRLRQAIERAKKAKMPAEKIEYAIKKGAGLIEGEAIEEVVYEGYGPGGVAIMVVAQTDNKNRTVAEIRNIFNKQGGKLGTSGSVSFLFERKGVIEVPAEGIDEEAILEKALEAGAEDVVTGEAVHIVYTNPEDLYEVKENLEKLGVNVEKAEISYIPTTTVRVENPEEAQKLLKLLTALEEHDDVSQVISNFDIPREIMAKIS
ncbi:MAG TPA: YebC/PmpR family DNA-binding transcriptional regulator [Aquifex aeolicus]|uniref:Probable transcriptional regulatory protein EYH37_00705 n=1 Tax=Aquifex aeolicus TaxID=63363 RepID=A0A9D0YP41_AQUAO|nr:YebC/PmpR family DNA-binding transcriptional regulator [Aquificales bacterium]HIP97877.1 YebC/PmpR family DNA-binding transcriptional regulator [Aquifex aeolicus]HIQ26814.1 YebC/PmpR family DNA-binding transcriptional regulator [Aquifex aeolicus]